MTGRKLQYNTIVKQMHLFDHHQYFLEPERMAVEVSSEEVSCSTLSEGAWNRPTQHAKIQDMQLFVCLSSKSESDGDDSDWKEYYRESSIEGEGAIQYK